MVGGPNSLFAFTDGQRLMRPRKPIQMVAGLAPRDRCSRPQHAGPVLGRRKSQLRESGHTPSLPAWIRCRPTNGHRLLLPGRWESILVKLFPSILLPPSEIIDSLCWSMRCRGGAGLPRSASRFFRPRRRIRRDDDRHDHDLVIVLDGDSGFSGADAGDGTLAGNHRHGWLVRRVGG